MTEEDEYVADLQNVLCARHLRYSLFSPSAEFNSESRDRSRGRNGGVFDRYTINGRVTFANQDGIFVATAYRVRGATRSFCLAGAYVFQSPLPQVWMITSLCFTLIYCLADEQLLKHTAENSCSTIGVDRMR